MNIPRNDEASSSFSVASLRSYWVLSVVLMVLDRKISYISRNSPRPIATTTLRCIAPIGKRSSG